jgi:hypothetical protein
MIITLVAGILMYGLVLLKTREDASMFTSSLVLSYVLYLQWSAFSSNENPQCNPFSINVINPTNNAKANTISMMCFGLFFTFASLLAISMSTKKADEDNMETAVAVLEDQADSGERVDDYRDVESGETKSAKDMHVFPITPATIYF